MMWQLASGNQHAGSDVIFVNGMNSVGHAWCKGCHEASQNGVVSENA